MLIKNYYVKNKYIENMTYIYMCSNNQKYWCNDISYTEYMKEKMNRWMKSVQMKSSRTKLRQVISLPQNIIQQDNLYEVCSHKGEKNLECTHYIKYHDI